MTASTPRASAAAASAAALPRTWEQRAAKLERLMRQQARARNRLTETFAAAYIEATGTDRYREQVAKSAAATAQLGYDDAHAELEAYKLRLEGERLSILASPPEVTPLCPNSTTPTKRYATFPRPARAAGHGVRAGTSWSGPTFAAAGTTRIRG